MCNGAGAAGDVIAGLDWVSAHAVLPAVVSLSLGSSQPSVIMDTALSTLVNQGITAIVAAGNYNNGRISQKLAVIAPF